jgi:hypothetical protein
MLNEVRSRHIKKLVMAQIRPGVTVGDILEFETARRKHTIGDLMAQKEREQDEIDFLNTLDAKELHKEAGEKQND